VPASDETHTWSDGDGVVHLGERAIRRDGTSDWMWADCGKRTINMHYINKSPNCLACLTGQDYGPYD
jgi:hypothetical protein